MFYFLLGKIATKRSLIAAPGPLTRKVGKGNQSLWGGGGCVAGEGQVLVWGVLGPREVSAPHHTALALQGVLLAGVPRRSPSCSRGRPGLALPHRARGAGSSGASGGFQSPGSERGGPGPVARPATARLRLVLGALRGPGLVHLRLFLPKQALTAGLPRRFAACQEWRGADHAVPAGGGGHPPQLREEDV